MAQSSRLKTTDKGGDVQVLPMANPDQLTLFLKKSSMEHGFPSHGHATESGQGNGRLFLDERTLWPQGQFVITNLIVSTNFSKTILT